MYADKVLTAWKHWDNNTLDEVAPMLADDVVGTFPDGSTVKGKANFIKGAMEYRGMFNSVTSQIEACTALKSVEHPESTAVAIWGFETDTKKDGTVQKNAIHEVWFFNKEGKVTAVHQYMAAVKDEMEKK